MPRTAAKPWERQIRQMVKASQGPGWLLRAGRGARTQAIRCWDDGTRSSVVLPIPWQPPSGATLLALIERLATVMATYARACDVCGKYLVTTPMRALQMVHVWSIAMSE